MTVRVVILIRYRYLCKTSPKRSVTDHCLNTGCIILARGLSAHTQAATCWLLCAHGGDGVNTQRPEGSICLWRSTVVKQQLLFLVLTSKVIHDPGLSNTEHS